MKSDQVECTAQPGGSLDGRLARIETKLDALIRTGDDQERRVRAVEQMVLTGDKKKPSIMNMLGNLTGILALATVIFYGGGNLERINAEIRSHNSRVLVLETQGSSPMREEIRQLKSEIRANEARLARIEGEISALQPELVKIGTRLEGLTQRMDRLHIGEQK